ncbi:hypothetical protein [Mycolicibacterium sp. XJ1819]
MATKADQQLVTDLLRQAGITYADAAAPVRASLDDDLRDKVSPGR